MNIQIKQKWSDAYGTYVSWPLWSETKSQAGQLYRYVYWPVRLRWAWSNRSVWLRWHGWEIDADWSVYPPARQFGWTFHLGPVKVLFGARS